MTEMSLVVTDYSFGRIKVGDKVYTNDIILYRETVTSWWRQEGHLVRLIDLEKVIDDNPSHLIIGTGFYGAMKVSDEVEQKSKEHEINLIIRKSEEACKLYNNLINQGHKDVVLAIHLTC